MAPAFRYDKLLTAIAWLLPVVLVLLGWQYVRLLHALPEVPPAALAGGKAAVLPDVTRGTIAWEVFRAETRVAPAAAGGLANRFRLIGTFFVYPSTEAADDPASRKAIILDAKSKQESITQEGGQLDDVVLTKVLRDHVTIRRGTEEVDLWLSFSGPSSETATGTNAVAENVAAQGAVPVAGRFGQRVSERHWQLERQKLLDYYRELMDEPDRLVAVFDSLKPLYDENRRISGYELGVEGEGKFFAEMGLREGDVVRKVNSVPMTNRARAEYFLRQFVERGANAFVIEVERSGKAEKFIYQVR